MPIVRFSGLSKSRVEEYYQQIDEICALIGAGKDNVFFVVDENVVINPKKSAYITVEWMQRLDKEQIFADHLRSFFAKDVQSIGIFFTDVNKKLYLNGQKLG